MSTLIDGPAAGAYSVARAPHYLRAVVGPSGRKDLLDQLEDVPAEGETVHVYEAVSEVTRAFVCGRSGGLGGEREWATYRHRADVDGGLLRDTDAWRAWCRAQISTNGGPTWDPVDPAFDDLRGRPAPVRR